MRKAYAIGIIVGCCVLFFDILTKWGVDFVKDYIIF